MPTGAYAAWQPLGPVLAVMPWNFPLWQAMRFAAPALMAGNVGLLKHASNVPQTRPVHAGALRAGRLSRRGVPDLAHRLTARVEAVIRDDRVVAVTLTGSGPAGSSVAAIVGEVVKKSVLELGGSDPFVIMPSADLVRAAQVAPTFARCLNNGQSCIAAPRLHRPRRRGRRVRTPIRRGDVGTVRGGSHGRGPTHIGPLASAQQRQDMVDLVEDAVAKEPTVLCGGMVPDGPGFYYPPTVLTDITPEMRIHTEEAFGPVATLYRVSDIDEAIELANATDFGLGANAGRGTWPTRNASSPDLEAGMVFINGNTTSFNELPFGVIIPRATDVSSPPMASVSSATSSPSGSAP